MAIGDIIIGIDIGTTKIATVVGEVNNFNQVDIIASNNIKCQGLQKGVIVDANKISQAIEESITDAQDETGLKIKSAYTTIPGKYTTIVQNCVSCEVKDKYQGISLKDVQYALIEAKDIEIPQDLTIIDIVPDKIVLDNGMQVLDPIGQLSSTFTLNVQIILAKREYIAQIHSIFKNAGLEIDGIIPNTLAQRNLALDKHELNDNIMILDFGAGMIDIGIFEKDTYIYTNSIPVGGENITNDISIVLNISKEEAEKLKRQYGLALKSYIDNDNDIILNTCRDISKSRIIKSSELIEIIEARVEQMFALVSKDINDQGLKNRINNVILTGQGITYINKSDVVGKINLNIPVKNSTAKLISTVKPQYRTAYGLTRYICARPFAKSVSSQIDLQNSDNIFKTVLEKIKDFFYT